MRKDIKYGREKRKVSERKRKIRLPEGRNKEREKERMNERKKKKKKVRRKKERKYAH